MKILIVSDSHGRHRYLDEVLEKIGPLDMVIHLGDLEGEEDYLEAVLSCPLEMVAGNNDYFSGLPREKIIEIGAYRILLTHGHRHHVYFGTDNLKEYAKANGCSMAFYGHTHIPNLDQSGDVLVLNPGSISQPRQDGHKPSYAIMEIDRFGEAHFTIRYVS